MNNDRQPLLGAIDTRNDEFTKDTEELLDRHKKFSKVFKQVKKLNKEIKSVTGYSVMKILSNSGNKKMVKYNINMPKFNGDEEVKLAKDDIKLYIALIKIICVTFGVGVETLLDNDKMVMGSFCQMLKVAFRGKKLAGLMKKIPKEVDFLNSTVIDKGLSKELEEEYKEVLSSYEGKSSGNKKKLAKARKLSMSEEEQAIKNFKKHLKLKSSQIGPLYLQHRDYCPSYTVTLHNPGTIGNEKKMAVVAFRGSLAWSDMVIDLDSMPAELFVSGEKFMVHKGMLSCAVASVRYLRPLLEKLDGEGYDLVVTGHSLGAGTAVILTCMLKPSIPSLHAIVFASPCAISKDLAQRSEGYIKNIVFSTDLVSRLGLYQILEAGLIYRQIKKKQPIDRVSIDNVLEKAGYLGQALYTPKDTVMFLLDEKGVVSFTEFDPKSKGKKAAYDRTRNYNVNAQRYFFDGDDMHMPFHPTRGATHFYHQILFCLYSIKPGEDLHHHGTIVEEKGERGGEQEVDLSSSEK